MYWSSVNGARQEGAADPDAMEPPGSEPITHAQIAGLDAITALKESAALELKEQGNEHVKKKRYSDAISCYTKAINQKALSDPENSIIYANRAHVNLLLGNYRRALVDAEEAIKLHPQNVKATYRAAKAALSLNLLTKAKSFCQDGLEKDPDNEELKKLGDLVDVRKSQHESHEIQVSKAVATAEDLFSAIKNRGLKIGKVMYQEFTGLRKPSLDRNNILHWPILLLYPEVMSSDFIEDFCEMDMVSPHLDMMFSEGAPPLPWDKENLYTREAVELYYEAGSGVCLSKTKILRYLLEGTVGSQVESIGGEETNEIECSNYPISTGKTSGWVRVDEKKTLHAVLKEPNFIIPGTPVFYVVSKRSKFYKDFKTGKWSPPA